MSFDHQYHQYHFDFYTPPPDPNYFSPALHQRFYSHVAIRGEDDCWEWLGGHTKDGYGIFSVADTKKTAHRYAKEMQLGEKIPRRLDASHTCENRSCVNPRHVVVETRKENMARMVPEPSPHRKLTWEQVEMVRHSPLGQKALANLLGVSRNTIWQLRRGLTYARP